jgi:hypothetical protein
MMGMNWPSLLVILFGVGVLAALVVSLVWQQFRPDKTAQWPVTEGTIRSVGTVVVSAGRQSYQVDVGDFSYVVNDEYYSGRLKISSSFSTHGASPRDLINQKIQVRYDPRKTEKFSVPPQEVRSFLLDPYDESPFASDIGLVDLNIDKN